MKILRQLTIMLTPHPPMSFEKARWSPRTRMQTRSKSACMCHVFLVQLANVEVRQPHEQARKIENTGPIIV